LTPPPTPAHRQAAPGAAKTATPPVKPKVGARAGAKPGTGTVPNAAPVAKPARPAKPPKAAKEDRPAKPPKLRQKPVRDSFTMPEADFSLVATLKARAMAAKRETKKSELLRAGLHALAAMSGATLVAALQALEPIKTGRPKNGR